MADIVFLALLIVHVGSIVSWMGGAVLFVSVITPSLSSMSPTARGEFVISTLPRFFRFIQVSSTLAVLAGLSLYGYMIIANRPPTPSALASLSAGALIALVALVIFYGIGRPAGRKMVALAKQMGQGPSGDLAGQLAVQQRKAAMASRIGVSLLGITLVLMIIGAGI